MFLASKTYEKQLRIKKTRLSHQVWSHGAGREDDWRVRPEEQARGQAQSAAPVPEASYCST